QGWNVATPGLPTDWTIKGTADIDNNGYADIIVQQQGTGIALAAMEGPTGFEHWNTVLTDPHWMVV
ncbi:MAG: hypothetical protein JOZ40_09540, partial [Methylobacteriaceae bacterium]|nr:hypothetical protein [Methylobacteriaceae bacterium]